ncbi:MAG: hypothetical protein GY874_12950 [Desulfobacteraceae bacterium]|nr:hypothetical protein [Desulfobacteraceae bacterium]
MQEDIYKPGKLNHGPQAKREKTLFRLLMLSFLLHVVFFAGAGVIGVCVYLKPDRIMAVNAETGEIIGEYRTTEYRTDKELLGASVKFAEHFLSLNADNIIEDIQISLNMMERKLALKRRNYIAKNNLVTKIKGAGARSWLEIDQKDGKRIHSVKGKVARIELKGKIVVDTEPEFGRRKKDDEKQVKITRKRIPFRLVLDCKMIKISDFNTSGVKIIDYDEIV